MKIIIHQTKIITIQYVGIVITQVEIHPHERIDDLIDG